MWIPDIQTSSEPFYTAIVAALGRDIRAGKLSRGDKLPTHRELAQAMGIARGTVRRAYSIAQQSKLIECGVGRGTFVSDRAGSGNDFTWPLVAQSSVVEMSTNWPLTILDPPLKPVLAALAKDSDTAELLKYVPVEGIPRHREAGAKWCAQWGVDTTADAIFVCTGSQHGIMVALMSVLKPGEALAVESYTYPLVKAMAASLGVELVPVRVDEGGLVPESFRAACRSRKVRALYTTPTIQNPTGSVLDERRRREIVTIAQGREVTIIEDDIQRLYADAPPPTMWSMDPENVIFLASTSKCVAGGLRVSYLVCPRRLRGMIERSVSATVFNAPPLMVEIVTRWLTDGTIDRTIERKRHEARDRVEMAIRILKGHNVRTHPVSLSVWLELPEPWTSEDFVLVAQRSGILVSSDRLFAVGERKGAAAVRLSLCAVDSRVRLKQSLEVIARILSSPPELSSAGQ